MTLREEGCLPGSVCFVVFAIQFMAAWNLRTTQVVLNLPALFHRPQEAIFPASFSSTPAGSFSVRQAGTLTGFSVSFLSTPASISASSTKKPTHDFLLACSSLWQQQMLQSHLQVSHGGRIFFQICFFCGQSDLALEEKAAPCLCIKMSLFTLLLQFLPSDWTLTFNLY